MNTDDYVPYSTALALKKAGFDWECDHYYCAFDNETDVRFWSIHPAQSQNGLCTPQNTVVADAPTLAQAQKWLRDKKGVLLWVYPDSQPIDEEYSEIELTGEWWWEIDGSVREGSGDTYPSYEAALSAGIAAALELIEEKGE